MEKSEFAVALSVQEEKEAVKEVALKIKSIFPKNINFLIILFTRHYNPANILKTTEYILRPASILGLQAPFLIFEGRIIPKGIVACCIDKEELRLKEFSSQATGPQEIESFLRSSFKQLRKENLCLLSFLSSSINPASYLSAARLSLGRIFNLLGAGYITKHSGFSCQIVNNNLNDGLVNVAIEGLQITSLRLEGYVALGKPFIITKASADRSIIIEINKQPAVNIYKHYLENRWESFIKNRLFSFYPLGIKHNGTIRLINVIDYLDDGSLMCMGEVKENSSGHLMLLDFPSLSAELKDKLWLLREKEAGVIFMVNSLTRKNILKDSCEEEIKLIKQIIGDKLKLIGLYSDYSFFSDKEKGYIDIETGNLLMALWQ